MSEIKNQKCPICNKTTLTLQETAQNIPDYGNCFIFSMSCSDCNYHKIDIESEEEKSPSKQTITIEKKEDFDIRVIKSSNATIKIPQLKISLTPNSSTTGYISTIKGILSRIKKILEDQRDNAEDAKERKSFKNKLKKLWKVECNDETLKITIEDPTGNSAILSKKTEIKKL